MLVMPSKTELFPADWSPHTTSCGKSMFLLMPRARRLEICRRRSKDVCDCRPDSPSAAGPLSAVYSVSIARPLQRS